MRQTWERVMPPGPDVTAVRDDVGAGVLWVRCARDGDVWWGDMGHDTLMYRSFAELRRRGTLTDATGEEGNTMATPHPVPLSPACVRALEVLGNFAGGASLRDLRANDVRVDTVRRLAARGLAFCARDTGDENTIYILTVAGWEYRPPSG